MVTIGIVGGGFSGLMTAYHLVSHNEQPFRLLLFNEGFPVSKGVAFSGNDPVHLLNVPAGKMSALPEDPEHFTRWISENHREYNPASLDKAFLPRMIYGNYLSEIFGIVTSDPNVQALEEKVTDVEQTDGRYKVYTNKDQHLVDVIVLATGNLPPAKLIAFESENYVNDPWNFEEILEKAGSAEKLFIMGSGLSMVDIILQLDKYQVSKKVICMSHGGLLPQQIFQDESYPSFLDELNDCTDLNEIYRVIKKHLRHAKTNEIHSQTVIETLRPYTQELWQKLSPACKSRFMRHLKKSWNVLRHRIPERSAGVIERWIDEEQLQVLTGKLKDAQQGKNGLDLTLQIRNKGRHTEHSCTLINCTGPLMDYTRVDDQLYLNLFKRSLASPGEQGIGLQAEINGKIRCQENSITPNMFTLGPTLKGVLWETTGVNEIRNQAKRIAKTILIENNLIT